MYYAQAQAEAIYVAGSPEMLASVLQVASPAGLALAFFFPRVVSPTDLGGPYQDVSDLRVVTWPRRYLNQHAGSSSLSDPLNQLSSGLA